LTKERTKNLLKDKTCYNCHFKEGFICDYRKDVIPDEKTCEIWTSENQAIRLSGFLDKVRNSP